MGSNYTPPTSVSGEFLCAPSVYAPTGAVTSLTASTTSMAAFSSANATTNPFIAPASGSVKVSVNITAELSASAAMVFGLAAHGTVTPILSNLVNIQDSTGTPTARQYQLEFVVNGLTPGQIYQFDLLGCATSGDTATILCYGSQATSPTIGNHGGPLTMSVQQI